MGKQYNKVEKRSRRLRYVKRRKTKLKIKKPAASSTAGEANVVAPAVSA
jgi:hypothetical protein